MKMEVLFIKVRYILSKLFVFMSTGWLVLITGNYCTPTLNKDDNNNNNNNNNNFKL